MTLPQIQLLTSAAIVAAALLFLVLERRFPYNRGQKTWREGFLDDLVLYNFLQSFLLGLLISTMIAAIDARTGLSRLRLIAGWPVWLQLAFFVVTHDFYIYWFHRWQHHSKYLWRLHEAHHSAAAVDWLSGVRSHAGEILINQTVEFLPIVLLGAAPEVALYKGAVSAIWGMYIHSNLDVRTGVLQFLLNGPEMHRWHHANDPAAYNKNFATKLAIWDWLFGTAYLPYNRKAKRYGLDYRFPKNYFRQLLFAFRKFEAPGPLPGTTEAHPSSGQGT
ncbi:MAG: sterol desaturase family protein [candidate division KSB1 bacterium]|nr:sterol desaturase family protein [candidate division KSB1 bacterium]MDZ7276171.1 sterol desaturase family protein [candidate division KSB1 bacterium]MDZ7287049.1 sterol desaturase family protein [candidate division KSB1 bacterium]MDZ7297026.1 sterol desaturase family protein [candidate division KSB1 bacterium]MDZ7307533.1 sterol desaturase family protein [candidate division KSB1 bacterium]